MRDTRRMPRAGVVRFAVAAAAVAAAVGGGTSAVARAGGHARLSWSAPATIDRQPPYGTHTEMLDVSCASASLSVAVDVNGRALPSTQPTGGVAARPPLTIDPGQLLTRVAYTAAPAVLRGAVHHRRNRGTDADP